VDGVGNSVSAWSYSFVDPNPLRGVSYTGSGKTGHDGTFTYSQVLTIKGWQAGNLPIIIYPNPGNGQIRIVSSGMIDEIKISNITGQIIDHLVPKEKIFLFNLSNQEFILFRLLPGTRISSKS